MARKKTKKHKKERRRHSISSGEGRKKDDIESLGSSRGKTKHEHFPCHVEIKQNWVKGTGSLRSAREESSKTQTCQKAEDKNKQAKVTGHKASLDSDRRALRVPVKHLPLGHGVHGLVKSWPDPEASSKELEGRRRSLVERRAKHEEPRWKEAEAVLPGGEKRKEVVKRRSSTQQDYPAAKQRATDAPAAGGKGRVARRSRDLGGEVLSNVQDICRTKTGALRSKESLSPVRNPAWSFKPKAPQNVRPETQGRKRQREPAGCTHGPSSGEEPTSYPALPAVSFKIPKKPSAAKPHRTTEVCILDHNDPVPIAAGNRAPHGCVPLAPLSARTGPAHSGPAPAEAPSPPAPYRSSRSQQAWLVEPGPVRRRSSPGTSIAPAWAERDVCQGTSTECTDVFSNDQEMLLVEELHLARFDRRLTVNVAESYGELTCMDVDPPEEGANTPLSGQQQDLLIVLDTNVLLSHLDFVKKMRSHGLGAHGRPTLLVPWVVLQELDALKSGKLSPEVERKARPAVNYVYGCLKSQEPHLWGQSLQQASQAASGLVTENNDDRVLQCCLQYQALHPEGSLILCTNDKNLCSKALLSGVKALCKADLVEQAEGNPALLKHSCNPHAAAHHAGPGEQEQTRRPREREEEVRRGKVSGAERELSACVSALESSLQGALSAVLETEMKAAFGDLWTEIVYLKPPWTLQAVLQCFQKHWIAVFGSIIKRNLLSCVETLSTCLCSETAVERGTVLTAARAAEELLMALSCRSSYGGRVVTALSYLRGLVGRPRTQLLKTPGEDPSDGDSLMSEALEDVALPPHASHQEVWALFESIWNNVCQVSSAVISALHCPAGTVGPAQSCPAPPPQDAISCFQRLSGTLARLLEVFHRLVSVDSRVEDARDLLTLVRTCEMTATESGITPGDLFACLSQREYREKLCVGGAQLMELKENLDRCAAAVCGQGEGTS